MGLIYFPTGIGEALGDVVVTGTRLYANVTTNVFYVDSTTGDDTYAGTDRTKPMATLGTAVAAAGAGDIVIMLDGHTETLTAAVDITGLTVVGAGSSGGYPTVKLTNNQAAANMISAGGAAGLTQLLNVWICEETQANSEAQIKVTDGAADGFAFRMRGCYIECGQYTDLGGMELAGKSNYSTVIIESTTFISVATAVTAQPVVGLFDDKDGGAGDKMLLFMDGVIFDNGTCGWSNPYAMDLTAGGIYRVAAENMSFLRGADFTIASATEGYLHTGSGAGGVRGDWTT